MGIGADSRNLLEMLEESERLFKETGTYQGVGDLEIKEGDYLRYERLFSRLRGCLVSSRETALHISASAIVRELGELCFCLYTPEGDSIVLSTGILVHVHTMSMAIKWMIEHDYEEEVGIRDGDIFCNNDALIGGAHTADVETIVPIFWEGELVGWVGGVTHVTEIGGIDAGSAPLTTVNRFGDGLYISAQKVGENDRLRRDYVINCERSLRTSTYWNLDEKCRIAGCHNIREGVREIIGEFGIDFYKRCTREFIEDGRRSFLERVKERLFPGRYRTASFFDGDSRGKPVPPCAQSAAIMHLPVDVVIRPDGVMVFDMEGTTRWTHSPGNASISSMQGGFWVCVTQMLAYDGRVNDGAYLATEQRYPYGSWANPDNPHVSTSAPWGPLQNTFNGLFRCLSRAFYTRGFREEIVSGYGFTCLFQMGGTDQYGRPLAMTSFEMSASGLGARGAWDGLDTGYAMWNPESDMGNVEIWELIMPKVYLGRRLTADSCGAGKYRGGSGYHSIYLIWGSDNVEVAGGCPARTFDNAGIFGGYPSARARYRIFMRDTNIMDVFANKLPYPSYEGSPRSMELDRLLDGDLVMEETTVLFPTELKQGDVFLQHYLGGPGYGDPLERDLSLVKQDLDNGIITRRQAENVYGAGAGYSPREKEWTVDPAASREMRKEARLERARRAVPYREWWEKERSHVLARDFDPTVLDMYREAMEMSPRWSKEFKDFWETPEEFTC